MFSNNPRHNCLASYNSGACVLLRRADIILRGYHHNIGSHSFQSSLHGNHSRSVPTPLSTTALIWATAKSEPPLFSRWRDWPW
jgi:hypothetical protein